MSLVYISKNEFVKKEYNVNAIDRFDCGHSSFNTFIREGIDEWENKLSGVTYFLIDDDVKKADVDIYAYATLSTAGFVNSDIKEDIKYISSLEIRLFAIHKRFRSRRNSKNIKYSQMFFAILLQDLWIVATTKLSFKTIYLSSNEFGYNLYKTFGFSDMSNYLVPTVDDKLEMEEENIPMIRSIDDDLMLDIFST